MLCNFTDGMVREEQFIAYKQLNPSDGQTITLASTDESVWTQSWELSILEGDTCTGVHTLHGLLLVNGATENLGTNTQDFILSNGVITQVATWGQVSYATLTPQTATIVRIR